MRATRVDSERPRTAVTDLIKLRLAFTVHKVLCRVQVRLYESFQLEQIISLVDPTRLDTSLTFLNQATQSNLNQSLLYSTPS